MNYKSFEKNKRKYPNLWKSIFEQSAEVKFIEGSQEISVQNIQNLKVTNTVYKNIVELSTEFEPIIFSKESDTFEIFAWKNYRITFENSDEKIISSIKPKFVFRFPSEDSVTKAELFSGEFILHEEKKIFTKTETGIVLDTGIMFQHNLSDAEFKGFKEDFEVKLLLFITSPNSYN